MFFILIHTFVKNMTRKNATNKIIRKKERNGNNKIAAILYNIVTMERNSFS